MRRRRKKWRRVDDLADDSMGRALPDGWGSGGGGYSALHEEAVMFWWFLACFVLGIFCGVGLVYVGFMIYESQTT